MSATTAATVAQWRPWIVGQSSKILGDQWWLYDDAQQEAMLAMWTRLEEGHPVPIALHKAKQAIIDIARGRRMTGSKSSARGKVDTFRHAGPLVRRNGPFEEYEDEPASPAAEAAFRAIDTSDTLALLLDLLTADQRAAIIAVHLEGVPAAEYAKQAGITRQGVEHRIRTGIRTMRGAATW